MIDSIIILSLVAAGIIAWVLCIANPRVFWGWKVLAPFVMIFPILYLAFSLAGNEMRMVLWSGMRVDWLTIGCALTPVLVWPIRSGKKAIPLRVAGTA